MHGVKEEGNTCDSVLNIIGNVLRIDPQSIVDVSRLGSWKIRPIRAKFSTELNKTEIYAGIINGANVGASSQCLACPRLTKRNNTVYDAKNMTCKENFAVYYI